MNYSFMFIDVNAATVDDMRELAGLGRFDSKYTGNEVVKILADHNRLFTNNRAALIFNANREIISDLNNKASNERKEIEAKVKEKEKELLEAYSAGSDLDTVFKLKAELSASTFSLTKIRDEFSILDIDVVADSNLEKNYEDVLLFIDTIRGRKDIGVVGDGLQSPVPNFFKIKEYYGVEGTTMELDKVRSLQLVGFSSSPILAQWNGVVKDIYRQKNGGYTLVIDGDKNMQYRYSNLKEIKVVKGVKVKQYDIVGRLMDDTSSFKTYLGLAILIDGKPINPLYLYGDLSRDALKGYISNMVSVPKEVYSTLNRIRDEALGIEPNVGKKVKPKPKPQPSDGVFTLDDGFTIPKPNGGIGGDTDEGSDDR